MKKWRPAVPLPNVTLASVELGSYPLHMDLVDIEALVALGESESLEFKRSTGQRSRIAEAVSAMANSRGGTILIGVLDDGRIVGQEVTAASLEGVHAEIGEIEPPLYPEILVEALQGGASVIVLEVGLSPMAPHVCRGRPFKRTGPRTTAMPQGEYQRLLLERIHASARWENQAGPLTLADVDATEVLRSVDEGVYRGRLTDPGIREPDELLEKFGLVTPEGHLLNAAAVLFGSRDALAVPYTQCVLRMARFRGVDKHQASDDRQVVANAFELLRLGEQFLLDHLPIASRFSPQQFERIDEPLYPPEALREALANALCHRDYSSGAGSIDIAMYDDRLEIVSAGGLHFGLRPADLYEPHPSRPWNPLIAGMFHRRGIIERWGSGTLKIVQLAHAAGLSRPEFAELATSLVVRFLPSHYAPPMRVNTELSPLQRDLLAIVARLGPSSLSAIRAELVSTIPERTVQNNLVLLRSLKLVESQGRARGARWSLRSA